ncbi:MAG: ABC transporter permease [Clostridiales bacterium]|nr:ABC transporter permease [Clostridiales bacterium]
MKNNIITVMRKEFARFFGDTRMLIMLLLPAVMIYLVYSFMGSALQNMLAPDEAYEPAVYVVNLPNSLRKAGLYGSVLSIEWDEADGTWEQVAGREADLLVIFPEDFDNKVAAFDVQTATGPAPNIEIYFNSANLDSLRVYETMVAFLDAHEATLANKWDINRDFTGGDLATQEDASATFIASLMPLLLLMFLYSGCMGLAPESIAGEKERGTIGALLVSPLKRGQLAMGKIFSLGILAFLSGLISALATILSLPKLMGAEGGISVDIYGASDYISLALVILSTILLLITLISIISAFSKTVKEATAAVTPLMIVVLLVGVTGMFGGSSTGTAGYLIPLYNSVQSMSGIFSLDYSAASVALTTASNLVFAFIGGFILTRMFNSERIMFNK